MEPVDPIHLIAGDYRDSPEGPRVGAVICDPPYSAKTHAAHATRIAGRVNPITYDHWSPEDVAAFVAHWAPRTDGWIVAMTSHDLAPAWLDAYEAAGRYAFHPIPYVHRGMNCRLRGDGPSSWAVWIVVSRPRSQAFARWGTLPGAYVLPRGEDDRTKVPGSKPTWLMRQLVRDYSRRGDLVCDPCAGGGTTLIAAAMEGRRSLGFEIDPERHAFASARIAEAWQGSLDLGDPPPGGDRTGASCKKTPDLWRDIAGILYRGDPMPPA